MDFEKATRNGAIAGFIYAILTLVTSAAWRDPWGLLEVVLIMVLAVLLLRKSRAAAIALFIHVIVSQIGGWVVLGRPSGIVAALIFLTFFGKAIAGSFAYHRLRRDLDSTYRAAARWTYFVWPPVALITLAVVLLGVVVELRPALTTVVSGDQLRQSEINLLVSEGVLRRGEHVALFYSGGFISIRGRGSILTDERVISYEEVDGELSVHTVPYAEIDEIVIEQKGSTFSDTIIRIAAQDGMVFRLLASTKEEGDSKLINELHSRWRPAREKRVLETAAKGGDPEAAWQLSAAGNPGAEADAWLCLAANRLHPDAQSEVARRYWYLKEDRVRGYMWYMLAAANGSKSAAAEVKDLRRDLTAEQLARAKRLAAAWKPTPERCQVRAQQER